MSRIRSVLWIGSGEGLAENRVAEAARLDVTWLRDASEALALPAARFDAAVLDARELEAGLSDLKRLRRLPRFPPILVRLAAANAASLREVLGAGAADVVLTSESPGIRDRDELVDRVDRIAAACSAAPTACPASDTKPSLRLGVLGTSPAMNAVFDLAERATRSIATVLLTGETGTGKEVIAHAIHANGPRRSRSFVAVNCAAFPDTLLESELFGHVRGAFTGADRDRPGLFEAARGGTLFLDEIAETSTSLQAKLLRVLQEREVRPLGEARTRRVDVRVITATNRDLRRQASRGAFRDDLYYRLAVFPIPLPSLRERREDILPLARHFLALYGAREGSAGCRLSREAGHLLLAHDWPGNVRELENEMQRVLAMAEPGETIAPAQLSERLTAIAEPVGTATPPGEPLRDSMARVEAWLVRRALERNGSRRAATARELGITREGLYKKMQRLGIE